MIMEALGILMQLLLVYKEKLAAAAIKALFTNHAVKHDPQARCNNECGWDNADERKDHDRIQVTTRLRHELVNSGT